MSQPATAVFRFAGSSALPLAAKLIDYGIGDTWIKEVADSIPPGRSALFVLARQANAERVLPAIAKVGGTAITSNLTSDQQQALQTRSCPVACPVEPGARTQRQVVNADPDHAGVHGRGNIQRGQDGRRTDHRENRRCHLPVAVGRSRSQAGAGATPQDDGGDADLGVIHLADH